MRVLVACEFSGIVREAFKARGHDAWSCDLLPTEIPGNHIQGDVLNILEDGWDMMIAHPYCTDTAVSGAWMFKEKMADGMQQKAIEFFIALAKAKIPKKAIEHPVSIMSRIYRKPDQIIQPFMFGHPESKTTCLWLENLLPLNTTNWLPLPETGRWNNQTKSGQNKLAPSINRAKNRSRSYPGIANAMAEQWG